MQDNPLNSRTAAVIMKIWISVRRYSREDLWSAELTPISPSFLLNCNKGLGVQIRLRRSAPRVDPRISRACLPSTCNTLAHSIATESTVKRQSTLRDPKSRSKYRKRRKESCQLYVKEDTQYGSTSQTQQPRRKYTSGSTVSCGARYLRTASRFPQPGWHSVSIGKQLDTASSSTNVKSMRALVTAPHGSSPYLVPCPHAAIHSNHSLAAIQWVRPRPSSPPNAF
jgi:hypothetical protein